MDQPPIGWSVYGYAAHRCELAASVWLDVAVNKVGHAGPKPYADPMWLPSPTAWPLMQFAAKNES